MSEMTIYALIGSKLADHRVDDGEYADILTQVKYGWVSKDEILEAHNVVAKAEQEVDEAFSGIPGAIARMLLEALNSGGADMSGLGQQAAKAADAMERRDCAKQLAKDLTTGRKGQGFMANAAADLLPEKAAGWIQSLF